MRGYLHDGQGDLFSCPRVVGYEDDEVRVRLIPKDDADAVIRAGHYSRSVVWSSSVHFGVYVGGSMIGALQYGPAMNPASGSGVVDGTLPENWLELNRMWLSDEKPANTATRAIAFSLRVIGKIRPAVQWVQAFADERCGKAGGVYQAASFLYVGSHVSTFYELDGEWFHKSMLGRKEYDKRGWWSGPKIARFNANKDRAVPHRFKQYRYLRFLDRRAAKRLRLPVLPYPRPGMLVAP